MGSTGKSTLMTGGGVAAPVSPITTNVAPANQNNPNVQSQVPDDQNTPVTPSAVTALTQMSDDELAALLRASKSAQMPNYLADRDDTTQKFVFQAGVNEKPMVLDRKEFNQYLKDNNIPRDQIIARSVKPVSYNNQQGYRVSYSADQVQDMLKYSKLTYIGGKRGGQAYGAGAYFAMTGGSSTGYGSNTAQAVLNPQTAKVIDYTTLRAQAASFDKTHPKFAKVTRGFDQDNASVYALAMGYNVITDHTGGFRGRSGDYYNVIDRKALVYLK